MRVRQIECERCEGLEVLLSLYLGWRAQDAAVERAHDVLNRSHVDDRPAAAAEYLAALADQESAAYSYGAQIEHIRESLS